MRDANCAYCIAYSAALREWRIKGGEMPRTSCQTDHRKPCKKCGELYEGKPSGLCDKCYTAPKGERPKRYNPLDLIKYGK